MVVRCARNRQPRRQPRHPWPGNFEGVAAPNDGLTQTITEAAAGVGSGLQVEYTVNTRVDLSQITRAGTLRGSVVDVEGRCERRSGDRGPRPRAGRRLWMGTVQPGRPGSVQAVPPSGYVDANGNVVIRFTDSAAIRRERKDMLTVDYLIARVGARRNPVPDPTAPANLIATR